MITFSMLVMIFCTTAAASARRASFAGASLRTSFLDMNLPFSSHSSWRHPRGQCSRHTPCAGFRTRSVRPTLTVLWLGLLTVPHTVMARSPDRATLHLAEVGGPEGW